MPIIFEDQELAHIHPDPFKMKDRRYEAVCQALCDYGFARAVREYAEGVTVGDIAERMGVHRSTVYKIFFSDLFINDPEEQRKLAVRREIWANAKKDAAEGFAERALKTAETAPDTTMGVQRARLQVETYKWRASTLNPDEYATNKGPQVQINLDSQFLESLKRRREMPTLPSRPALPDGDADYEVQ